MNDSGDKKEKKKKKKKKKGRSDNFCKHKKVRFELVYVNRVIDTD